ncbi:hypothetical protein Tco_1320445 [Tanacetum coccineum]
MTRGASGSSVREQENVPLQCPKLIDTNYTTWALMMETILKAYGLWKVIDAKKETDGKKETGGEQKTAIDKKAENTANGMIFQTLPQDMLMQVAQYTTAKEVWISIKVKHLGANLVQKARLQTLRSELETLKMKPDESASEFAGELSSIQANSQPDRWVLSYNIQEIDTMQFEEAVGRITAFEERIKSQDTLEANDQDKLLLATLTNKVMVKGELSRVHSIFHISKLKKCIAEEPLAIPLDEIQVDKKLHFIEEPIEIMDHEVKRLKQSRIPIVKVHWNSRRGPEFTWECEDQMQKKYPNLFPSSAPVMAISVISVSSDSSEDSGGTPARGVILFGTIPTTIPDTTPVITPPITQTDTTSDPYEDPSSDHIPPLPAISPFLSSADDTTDSDTPDIPPSPTHAPGQPIPHGRPYRYHLNMPVHMMTARKRVGPLPVQQLAVRHSVDHSLSDYFSPDDSARDSSSDSSSEASLDFHSDASSDSSSRHLLSDHSFPDLPSTSARPSHKRHRSPMTSVPALPPVSGALSLVCVDLIPSPKRIRDSGYLADLEVDHRETSLKDNVIVRGSDEPHLEQDIDPEIQADINECFAYADALRDKGIDARVVVEAVDRVESETGARGPVKVRVERKFHDHTKAIPFHRIQVIKGVQREQEYRIVRVESAIAALTERIAELERDNRRLKCTASVESQRVDRL